MSDINGILVHTLPNGLTITLERLPYLRSATAGLWIHAGSGIEGPNEAGLAHFLEHLFFKGTTTRSVHQLMEAVESKGGQLNGFTSREYTCLYTKTLDTHLPVAIEILADIIKNSTFADLEKERNVVLEEIASVEDSPEDYVFDALTERHWPAHALGRSVSGDIASVSSFNLDIARAFRDRWYTPSRMFFSVAGNFDPETVLAQICAEFEPIAPGPKNGAPSLPPAFVPAREVLERDISQAHLCLAFPAPALHDEERFVCDLTSNVLGGASTSRLFERVREDEGLAYAIYTFHNFYRLAGCIGVYAAIAPQNCARVLDIVYEELREIRDEPMDFEELDLNREQIKGNLLMAMESTFTRMARMAKCMMYYGRIIPVDEVIAKVEAINEDAVRAFAEKTFRPEVCSVVALGSTGGCDIAEVAL